MTAEPWFQHVERRIRISKELDYFVVTQASWSCSPRALSVVDTNSYNFTEFDQFQKIQRQP